MAQKPKWDKHSIKTKIHRRGKTLNSLGAQYGLNDGDISKALNGRFPKAEQVIAHFLGQPVWVLWEDRYDETSVPIRYLRKPQEGKLLTRAARNRLNQARGRRAALAEAV